MSLSVLPIQYKCPIQYNFKGNTKVQSPTNYQPINTTNPNLNKALNELENLTFSQDDIKYVQNMGVNLPFTDGKSAVNFMTENNIKVCFAPLSSPHIHAQYDDEQKLVKINNLYKDSSSLADITAIA